MNCLTENHAKVSKKSGKLCLKFSWLQFSPFWNYIRKHIFSNLFLSLSVLRRGVHRASSALVGAGDDGDNTDEVIQPSVDGERRKVRGLGSEEKGMTRE